MQVEALPLGGARLEHAADRLLPLPGVPRPRRLVVHEVLGEFGVPVLAAVGMAGVVGEEGHEGRTGVLHGLADLFVAGVLVEVDRLLVGGPGV